MSNMAVEWTCNENRELEIHPTEMLAHGVLADFFGPTIRLRQINSDPGLKEPLKIKFKGTLYFDPANGIRHIGIYRKDIEAKA